MVTYRKDIIHSCAQLKMFTMNKITLAQKGFIIPLIVFLLAAPQIVTALERESDHFIFYYAIQDSSIVDSIQARLEGCYDRITGDLQLTISTKVKIHIYPTLQEFHNAIGWYDAPDWLVGIGNQEIYVVSPLNPGPAHSYNDILNNVFIHEFTHVCTGKINVYLPYWLSEGFACFEGGPYYSKASVVSAYNSLGRIPSLDELNSSYDNFVSFGGYPFSLTITRYAIGKFSMDAMRQFIQRPNDYSVFGGLLKNEFQENWFNYVKENYLGITSVSDIYSHTSPYSFALKQNYPNPFNPVTVICYQLAIQSVVSLKIFDLLGRELATLIEKEQNSGSYEVTFDAGNLSSGVYLYRIQAGTFIEQKKLTLMK
jgi:hypothetical protein